MGRHRRAPDLLPAQEAPPGHAPAALATPERDIVAIYLPVGGEVAPALPDDRTYVARWFDPRTAELRYAAPFGDTFRAPGGTDERGHPWDWVLVLTGE